MISISYINGDQDIFPLFDPVIKLENELDSIVNDINSVYVEYTEAKMIDDMNEMFNESEEEKKSDTAHKNFVDALGAGIIKMFDKVISFVQSILDKIKEATFSSKSDLDKVDALIKEHPNMADSIKEAFIRGDLKLSDAKSLNDLNKQYSELIADAKKASVDPNSLEAKWEKAKEAFEKAKAPAATILGITAGALTLHNFAPQWLEQTKKLNDIKKNINEQKAIGAYKAMTNDNSSNKINDKDRYNTIMLKASREYCGIMTSEASSVNKFIYKIQNIVASVKDVAHGNDSANSKFRDEIKARGKEALENQKKNAKNDENQKNNRNNNNRNNKGGKK